jgi:molybdopterin converting factor small subunit
MHVKLRLYGHLIDIPGNLDSGVDLDFPLEAGTLRALIDERFPGLRGTSFRIAVDHHLLADGEIIHNADELALLPPASGG